MLKADTVRIKQKILGVLILKARSQVGLTIAETSKLLGIPEARLVDYEFGRQGAGLPELESMARIFNVPVSFLWTGPSAPSLNGKLQRIMPIRCKIIGVLLRKARQESGKSLGDIGELLGHSPQEIEKYELGQVSIPFNKLELVASSLNLAIDYFLEPDDKSGVITVVKEVKVVEQVHVQSASPTPAAQQAEFVSPMSMPPPRMPTEAELAENKHLPEDIKKFLQDPANVLYLKLSMKLQAVSAENLRSLAEGILDITY